MPTDPMPDPAWSMPCDYFDCRLQPEGLCPPGRPIVIEFREYHTGIEQSIAFGVPDVRDLHERLGELLAEADGDE